MLKNNLKFLQHSNDPVYFQRLNLVFLKDYAKSVVTRFSEIPFDRIVLYRYRNKHFPFKWFNIKYAMVFFVQDTVDHQSYEKFEAASGIRQTVMDDMPYVEICVDQHFSEAYKDNSPEDYIGEWFFIPQLTSEAIYPGVEVEGHKWILSDARETHSLPDVIEGVKPGSQNLASPLSSPQADGILKNHKKETEQNVDVFVRELTVMPESDLEIKIKRPGKSLQTFNHERLEFKDNKAKEWTVLLRIINNSGSYNVGQPGTPGTVVRKEYDRKLAYLRAIDKKLKTAFRKEFALQLPDKYHLYERFKTEGYGVYKFKFRVEFSGEPVGSKLKAKYETYPKEKLLKHLKEMAGQQARTLGNGFKSQIDTIRGVLLEKYGMDNGDIEDYIDPKSDHEKINNIFSNYEIENEPLRP